MALTPIALTGLDLTTFAVLYKITFSRMTLRRMTLQTCRFTVCLPLGWVSQFTFLLLRVILLTVFLLNVMAHNVPDESLGAASFCQLCVISTYRFVYQLQMTLCRQWTSFSLYLMGENFKLKLAGNCLPVTKTLAYRSNLYGTKKIKCCEYDPECLQGC